MPGTIKRRQEIAIIDRKECPFCNLESLQIIEENEKAIVFFSNPRLVKGHLLVIPKRHIEKPWELTAKERSDIFELLFKYQQIITDKMATGCDIKENYRPFLSQSRLKVDHVHFHLIPRELYDDIWEKVQGEADLFRDIDEQELSSTHKKLAGSS